MRFVAPLLVTLLFVAAPAAAQPPLPNNPDAQRGLVHYNSAWDLMRSEKYRRRHRRVPGSAAAQSETQHGALRHRPRADGARISTTPPSRHTRRAGATSWRRKARSTPDRPRPTGCARTA